MMGYKVKTRKPRTKVQKKIYVSKCPYYDGDSATECSVPWIYRGKFDCGGNIHLCNKERYRWLSSLSDKERTQMMDKGW